MEKRLQLKLKPLLDGAGVSMNAVSRQAGVSYPTVLKYVKSPEDVQYLDLSSLYCILRGIGLSEHGIEQLRLGAIFEVVENAQSKS